MFKQDAENRECSCYSTNVNEEYICKLLELTQEHITSTCCESWRNPLPSDDTILGGMSSRMSLVMARLIHLSVALSSSMSRDQAIPQPYLLAPTSSAHYSL